MRAQLSRTGEEVGSRDAAEDFKSLTFESN